jgi:signal transduction histidine kinase
VFDKSFRGSKAAGVAGSGLGLYMARSIADVHGGYGQLRGMFLKAARNFGFGCL